MKLGESIIFGAGRIRPVVFAVEIVDTNYRRHEYRLRIVVKVVSPWRQSNYETDVFCVWRGRQVFCEFPQEWSFEIVIGEDILKQGFEYV